MREGLGLRVSFALDARSQGSGLGPARLNANPPWRFFCSYSMGDHLSLSSSPFAFSFPLPCLPHPSWLWIHFSPCDDLERAGPSCQSCCFHCTNANKFLTEKIPSKLSCCDWPPLSPAHVCDGSISWKLKASQSDGVCGPATNMSTLDPFTLSSPTLPSRAARS